MHRRFIVVALAAGDDVEAALEASQTAAIEIVFEAHPGVAGAQIEITEDHAAEMGEMGDAALAGAERVIESDGADDPDKMLHLDWKKKVKINRAIGIDQTVGKQNPIDAGRRADAGNHLIGQEDRVEKTSADGGNKIVTEKKIGAPAPLQIGAEHPHREHVEQ